MPEAKQDERSHMANGLCLTLGPGCRCHFDIQIVTLRCISLPCVTEQLFGI